MPASALVAQALRGVGTFALGADRRGRSTGLIDRLPTDAVNEGLGGSIRDASQPGRSREAHPLAPHPATVADEPLAGLSSGEAATMADLIRTLPAEGITVLLVEHNLGEVLRVADRIVVLDAGRVLAEGAPAEVMAREDVRRAYTG